MKLKTILALLFLVGLVAAPGYYFYCTILSGKSVGERTVFTQEVSQVSFGGFTQSSNSGANWNSPAKFELSPEMNPISVIAKFKYLKPRHMVGLSESNNYLGRLSINDQEIWSEDFALDVRRDKNSDSGVLANSLVLPTSIELIKTFTINESGSYDLSVKETGKTEIAVADIEMSVRRNVLIPNMKIVIGGTVALLSSIVGFVLILIQDSRSRTG